ncbi:MAG TPA: hypothetical protein VGX68_17865 [Thermoanaerobaculia bacterium]|jgi:hypothetical protein|nr:hypothetical protein [Thermoanaerobaculia bacterium]
MIRQAFPLLLFVFLALAVTSCAEAPRPAAAAASPAGDESAAFERALGQALKRQAWSDLRIDTECRTEDGYRSATVFGSGVGVWNRERQAVLPRDRVLSLLRELAAAGFPRMPETYGEAGDEAELICSVRLDLEGSVKQVHQLATGPQSRVLMGLARRILAAAEEAGRGGPQAASLGEGLGKIARGELAPELLLLHILRQSETSGSAAGWELGIEGGKATLQRLPMAEDEAARTVHLGAAELAELAGQLAAARLEELPANLWAPEYTDFEVRVLNRHRSLQARQFAGLTPETHGEAQQRFDRLWQALEALYRRHAAA